MLAYTALPSFPQFTKLLVTMSDDLSQFNDDPGKVKLSRRKSRNQIEQLKPEPSTKSTTADQFTVKNKKHCQILRLLRQSKNNPTNQKYAASTTHISPNFSRFLL